MKRKLFAILFFFLLMEFCSAEPVPSMLPQEAQQVEAKAASLRSYRSKFTLETREKGGSLFRIEGTILFEKPNRRRLEMRQSTPGQSGAAELSQLLVCDGIVEWQYYPEEKTVYKSVPPPESPGPHRPFAEMDPDTIRFIGTMGGGSNSRLRFEAVPLSSVTEESPVQIKTIRVDIEPSDGLVRELVLLDEKGQAVLTQQYRDIETNIPVLPQELSFTPPEGVSVVDVDAANQNKEGTP